jgi:hypothetical protein
MGKIGATLGKLIPSLLFIINESHIRYYYGWWHWNTVLAI